jgi:galactokinase
VTGDLEPQLVAAGLTAEAAHAKARLFGQAERRWLEIRERQGKIQRFYVPGRIEVLGKHTDYAGGRSLLCAADRGICLVASPRSDETVHIADVGCDCEAEFSVLLDPAPRSHWMGYVTTVTRRLVRDFRGQLRGVDLAFASDLPAAAGMSSSSTLMIAVFAAFSAANHLLDRREYQANVRSPEDLATYLACMENGQGFGTFGADAGVGTQGGSEDHIAILCCQPGTLSQYAFCPARRERDIAFGDDLTFVIGASGAASQKTGAAKGAYNCASRAAAMILQIWREDSQRDDPTLSVAIRSSADATSRIREALRRSKIAEFPPSLLLDRFEQFLLESDIIPAASAAFAQQNWHEFGHLVDQSQSAAETLLKNQIAETIELARSARQLGAIAASAFGAGFGGSVWALVPIEEARRFTTAWEGSYRRKFPRAQASQFFSSRPGPAVLEL